MQPPAYLDVFCQGVEHLLGNVYGLGEVSLTLLINDIFPRIKPVKVTDRLLQVGDRYRKTERRERQQKKTEDSREANEKKYRDRETHNRKKGGRQQSDRKETAVIL